MLSKKQKCILIKSFKQFHKSPSKNEIDLKYFNLINKYSQRGKIAVVFSSDSLVEDLDDGTKLVQKPNSSIEVDIINSQYTAFKHCCNYFERFADSPYFISIDYISNHKNQLHGVQL